MTKMHQLVKEQIIQYFENKPEIAAVYLYGSQVKDYARENSDIDLAVLVNDRKSFSGFDIPQTRYTYDLEKLTGQKVEVQDLGLAPVDFAFKVISEGEILIGLDSKERVDFEEKILRVYFDMKSFFNEYSYYIGEIAKRGELDARYI